LMAFACGERKSQKTKSEIQNEKRKTLDSLNEAEAKKLAMSFDANIDWDTTYCFTYSIQELFEANTRPVSFTGEINDVFKKDSLYILKIVNSNWKASKQFIAEISIDKRAFQQLKSKLNPEEDNQGCFIFRVTKITSHSPVLKSEIDPNGESVDDASSYLTLDFYESIVKLEGNLVSCYLYQRLE
jgi:hypothetical protein